MIMTLPSKGGVANVILDVYATWKKSTFNCCNRPFTDTLNNEPILSPTLNAVCIPSAINVATVISINLLGYFLDIHLNNTINSVVSFDINGLQEEENGGYVILSAQVIRLTTPPVMGSNIGITYLY